MARAIRSRRWPGFTIWLDGKLELFFAGEMIVSGWESTMPAILAAQARLNEARQRQLASTLMHRPERSLAFEHARLFDPQSRRLMPNTTVLIDGDRIAAVGRDGTITLPHDAERIDAHNRVMLPGLGICTRTLAAQPKASCLSRPALRRCAT
jgi:hypothetical protein